MTTLQKKLKMQRTHNHSLYNNNYMRCACVLL